MRRTPCGRASLLTKISLHSDPVLEIPGTERAVPPTNNCGSPTPKPEYDFFFPVPTSASDLPCEPRPVLLGCWGQRHRGTSPFRSTVVRNLEIWRFTAYTRPASTPQTGKKVFNWGKACGRHRCICRVILEYISSNTTGCVLGKQKASDYWSFGSGATRIFATRLNRYMSVLVSRRSGYNLESSFPLDPFPQSWSPLWSFSKFTYLRGPLIQ
ncbi:hypothetical protein K458DRAFT_107343 [Lentithecium fluviatile CBS 122367]|uniref:Uncharacterized protein n=1 Tax=Lentithecium fluviatile CBS 122367 TaxID=1168545 RepID=A0A6G1IQI9_9PLEO|nr:hypothetical protein K458DRAFT_107343 [Lentithecium fluviatile CBS 122367]